MRITCYVTDIKQDWERFDFRGIKPLLTFFLEGIIWSQVETITIQIKQKGQKNDREN